MKFVVYWIERLRDGTEEGAKVLSSKDEVVRLLETLHTFHHNLEVHVFELGKPVKFAMVETLIPVPPQKTFIAQLSE